MKDDPETEVEQLEIQNFVSEILNKSRQISSPEDTYLTFNEVCAMFRVSRNTLQTWIKNGDFIRPIIFGALKDSGADAPGKKHQLWRLSDIRKFVKMRNPNDQDDDLNNSGDFPEI